MADETVIWRGKPGIGPRFGPNAPVDVILGGALAAGPVGPIVVLWSGGSPLWPVLVPIGLTGLALACGVRDLLARIRRRRTRYYVSDQRAVIDVHWPWGIQRQELPLDPTVRVVAQAGHIHLITPDQQYDPRPANSLRRDRAFVFEYLDDCDLVVEQMQHALTAASHRPETLQS